jgi:hypothetical protein
MNIAKPFRAAVLAAAVWVAVWGGMPADKIADNAKIYQAELEAMKGQGVRSVLDKLTGWKFGPKVVWETEDAASKDFKKKNTGKTKFTKDEIAEIFGPAGKYRVGVFVIVVGTETSTTGEVDEYGKSIMKDATYTVEIFTAIRVVFRDDKLVHVKTWPKLESSAVSGGTWQKR